eukprot:8016014-Pyramimonas_sp.AAC.1
MEYRMINLWPPAAFGNIGITIHVSWTGKRPSASQASKMSHRPSSASSLRCSRCVGWRPSRLLEVVMLKVRDARRSSSGEGRSRVDLSGIHAWGASFTAFHSAACVSSISLTTKCGCPVMPFSESLTVVGA